jgi:hypothetical protein
MKKALLIIQGIAIIIFRIAPMYIYCICEYGVDKLRGTFK